MDSICYMSIGILIEILMKDIFGIFDTNFARKVKKKQERIQRRSRSAHFAYA